MEDRVTVQPQIKNHSGLFKFTERVTDIILVNRNTVRVPTVMENPGKKIAVMEKCWNMKISQKVMEKSWNCLFSWLW